MIFQFGDFEYDAGQKLLKRNGAEVPIGVQPCLVLEAFLLSPGKRLTFAEIMQAAWPNQGVIADSRISRQVSDLRKILGFDPKSGPLQTIRGYGFVLRLEVTTVRPDATRPATSTESRQAEVLSDQADEPGATTGSVDDALSPIPLTAPYLMGASDASKLLALARGSEDWVEEVIDADSHRSFYGWLASFESGMVGRTFDQVRETLSPPDKSDFERRWMQMEEAHLAELRALAKKQQDERMVLRLMADRYVAADEDAAKK